MIPFLQHFLKTVEAEPDRAAVVDRDGTRVTTYRELCSCALRVNAWIRAHGLGRESVSAIYFPKCMEYVATRIGIIMAGSAWVGLEDRMGKERIAFVIRDSGCKAVFDREKWSEAMQFDECHEIADSDPHDLAFIIYTSGSTGTPKGIMQEYGLYDRIMDTANELFIPYGELIFAEVAPQTFLSGVFSTVSMLNCGGTLHEISYEMARDIKALLHYFVEKQITVSFLPPLLLKLFLDVPALRLRVVCTGGDNVSEIYTLRFDIANVYSSSEFGYPVSRLIIDQPYANTPIGYPTDGTELVLLDEKGLPSDEGECCIHLPFFRGYLGDNSRCFVSWNGDRYFRSSDYVRRDEKGRYTVLSRMDDMVKINGNRVDTREVEAAVKNTLHVDFCCVRPILRNGIRFLTAYYTADREIDSVQAARALRECISEYMIPSVYIRLETVPVNANGKVDKRALPEPDQALRAMPYSAPEDPVQEQLCKTYQRVLALNEGVGIDDDFFTLGGDSLRAMEVLSSCDIPGLSVQMIYKGRTVRQITELLNEAGKKEKAEEGALTLAPLNIGQLYLLRSDLMYPGTCMLNLAVRLNILPAVDMNRLAGAIRRTIKAHPALLSTIVEKNGSYFLAYRPEFDREIPVEEMTDDALEQEAERFVHPFRLDGTPLVRCRVIQAEKKRAVFLDVYHVLCDGISLNKLISDFGTSYAGGEIAPDPCYSQLREEESYRTSEQFRKDMDYFAELCDRPGWDTLPRLDHDTNENTDDTIFKAFPFSSEEADRLVKKYGFGKNGLYIAAAALSIAAYNESENIMFTWTWHDRSNRKRADSVVLFTKDIPVALRLKPGLLLSELFDIIRTQIREGVSHGRVSYWIEKESYRGKDLVCLLYQGDTYEYHEDHGIFRSAEELTTGPKACNNSLDIEILDGREEFGVLLDYNARKYDTSSMERFAAIFCEICERLVRCDSAALTVGDAIRHAHRDRLGTES